MKLVIEWRGGDVMVVLSGHGKDSDPVGCWYPSSGDLETDIHRAARGITRTLSKQATASGVTSWRHYRPEDDHGA